MIFSLVEFLYDQAAFAFVKARKYYVEGPDGAPGLAEARGRLEIALPGRRAVGTSWRALRMPRLHTWARGGLAEQTAAHARGASGRLAHRGEPLPC